MSEQAKHIDPITKLTIRDERTETYRAYCEAKINERGGVVLEGWDSGKLPSGSFGGGYEYWLGFTSEFKDSVLLLLIKEHFRSSSELMAWLDANKIPRWFDSHVEMD